MEARRQTGPLFWLHGDESRQRLDMYVGKVAEGGNGCFTTESRPHKDWLGEGWFRDLAICLDAAKKHNLKMWVFDEKWWPARSAARRRYGEAADRAAVDVMVREFSAPARRRFTGHRGQGREAIDGATLVELRVSRRHARVGRRGRVENHGPHVGPASGAARLSSTGRAGLRRVVPKTVYQPHYDR
jgi:hypothetical protein